MLIVIISLVVVIGGCILGYVMENNIFKSKFPYSPVYEILDVLNVTFICVFGVTLVCSLFIGVINNIVNIGQSHKIQQEYEYLIYCCEQVDNGYGDKLNLNNAKLIEEVGNYNKKVACGKGYYNNLFTRYLCPSCYKDMPLIDLNTIKFVDDNELTIDMSKMEVNFN